MVLYFRLFLYLYIFIYEQRHLCCFDNNKRIDRSDYVLTFETKEWCKKVKWLLFCGFQFQIVYVCAMRDCFAMGQCFMKSENFDDFDWYSLILLVKYFIVNAPFNILLVCWWILCKCLNHNFFFFRNWIYDK